MNKILLLILSCILFTSCGDNVTKHLEESMERSKKGEFFLINNFVESLQINYYDKATNIKEAATLYTEIIKDSLINLEKEIDLTVSNKFTSDDDKIEGYITYNFNYFTDHYKNILSSYAVYSYTDNIAVMFYDFDIRQYRSYPYVNNVSMLVNDTLRLKEEVSVIDLKHYSIGDEMVERIRFNSFEGFGKDLTDNLSLKITYKLSGTDISETRNLSKDNYEALLEVKEFYLLLKKKEKLVDMTNKIKEYMDNLTI